MQLSVLDRPRALGALGGCCGWPLAILGCLLKGLSSGSGSLARISSCDLHKLFNHCCLWASPENKHFKEDKGMSKWKKMVWASLYKYKNGEN